LFYSATTDDVEAVTVGKTFEVAEAVIVEVVLSVDTERVTSSWASVDMDVVV